MPVLRRAVEFVQFLTMSRAHLDLRALGDGTFAATITVNKANLASDPVLLELQGSPVRTTR